MRSLIGSSWILGPLIVAFAVALSTAGLYLVRRRFSHATLKENNEVAGFIYAAVAVIYAVIIAFIVVAVWEQYSEAEESAHQEAGEIGNLMRDAQGFPDQARDRAQQRLFDYARAVTEEEWEAMGRGETGVATSEAYEQIWQAYYDFQPQGSKEEAFYNQSLERLNAMGQHRRTRLHVSKPGLPLLMWVLMVGGGIITVGFTYLFGTKSAAAQLIIVGLLAGLIGFVLFLILALDYPFTGDLAIEPEAMREVMEVWRPRLNR
jgi:amino acid transporter